MRMQGQGRLWWTWGVLGTLMTGIVPGYTQDAPPLSSVRDLTEARRLGAEVLLRGSVTHNGSQLFVQDGTGALVVEAEPGHQATALGDEVEVRGTLDAHPGALYVRDGRVKILWAGSNPLPLAISPDEAAEGAYNGMLVATEGRLIKEVTSASGARRLTMDSGNQLFTCVLEGRRAVELVGLDVGASLRCTGVLSVGQAEGGQDAGIFLVLLRNPGDVHLQAAAPWWTARHLLALFGLLLALGWMAYRMHLRNVRARLSMIVEERSRIAREIHDTLAQGFAGIALQLQGVARTMSAESAAANEHLGMALQMVRRSRAEAHRSIAALRTLHSSEDLASMCERLLQQLTGPAQLRLTVVRVGEPRPLEDEALSQLLRIVQEAVANTVEHAGASSVELVLRFEAAALVMEITDDGCGYDPVLAGTLQSGHFGITGMRERAAGMNGTLEIASGAWGTRLRLRMPLTRRVRRGVAGRLARRLRMRRPIGAGR